MSNPTKRITRFSSFDEVLAEVESLRKTGYEQVGNWSLGQMCNHLAGGVNLSLNAPRFVMKPMIFMFFSFMFLGRIGGAFGLRVPTSLPQNQPVEDEVGELEYRRQLERLLAAQDATLTKFNLWHANHHLRFLVPRES